MLVVHGLVGAGLDHDFLVGQLVPGRDVALEGRAVHFRPGVGGISDVQWAGLSREGLKRRQAALGIVDPLLVVGVDGVGEHHEAAC